MGNGPAGGKDKPTAKHQVVHALGHQHRDFISGKFRPCPPDCAPPPDAVPGASYPCNSKHDRWILTATDSAGRLRLLRHIQAHYDCQMAVRFMVRPGTAGVSFAAMLADSFCEAGLFRTHTHAGIPIDRFAYWKAPLNDYRWAIQQGGKADIDFIAALLLSGEWRKEDITGYLPTSNLVDFDPDRPA